MSAEIDVPRWRLLEMKANLLRRLTKIDGDIQRKEGALERDSQERAMQLENDETLDALDEAACCELARIDQALEDLDDGRYGICRDCGRVIGPGRMEALPFAVHCVECAEKAERA